MASTQLITIGSALGIANQPGSLDFSEFFQPNFWQPLQSALTLSEPLSLTPPQDQPQRLQAQKILLSQLHRITRSLCQKNQPFVVLGGDHSCAMGSWGGLLDGLTPQQELGLIWLDAHMDAHTFDCSPSNNLHGMPLAALLGSADSQLRQIHPGQRQLRPENLRLIGIRDYEISEKRRLEKLGVKITYRSNISADGLGSCLCEAVCQLQKSCSHIAISLDLDVLSPQQVPAVATPVADGLDTKQLCRALQAALSTLSSAQFAGLEISEYYPHQDIEQKTRNTIGKLLQACANHLQKI